MSVRFVLGRAGTGKTRHCFDMAREECRAQGLAARVWLLLPPQGTFMAERQLACGQGEGSIAGVQVVSFESLLRELLGEDARLAVSTQGRRLVLGHLLRQHQDELLHFRKSASQAHLAARVDAALMEMENAGITLEQLESAGGGASPSMAEKLHDLKLLQGAWEAFLGQERVDPLRRLKEAAARLGQQPALRGARVLVDGFVAFSDAQRQLLVAMARAGARMDVCLLMDPRSPVLREGAAPAGQGLFYRGENTHLKLREAMLKEGLALEPPLLLERQHRAAGSPALARIERGWHGGQSTPTDAAEVLLAEAPSPRQEVEQAARLIREWQRQGTRLRDIGVFARQLDAYHAWVGAVFGEYDIPCFIDRRRPMSHHALLRLVRGLLTILRAGWRQETVIELLKCGLLPLADEEADRLENFALRHGIDHNRWVQEEAWHFLSRPAREEEAPNPRQREEIQESAACDALRRKALFALRGFVAGVGEGEQTVRQHVVRLYELLEGEELGLRAKLANWIGEAREGNDHEMAAEHEQAWLRLTRLLQEFVDLLGEARMDGREFAATLEAGMEGFDLAVTPPTLDQVLVGQIDRSRSPEFKHVIVLGLSEGIFPLRPTEDCIFSDAERQAMLARGVDLGRDSLRDILDERLLGYVAFTRASQTLVLSRHTHDEAGTELPPSPFLAELGRLVGIAASPPEEEQWLDSIATPAAAAQRLGAAVRASQIEQPLPVGAEGLYNWLVGQVGSKALAEALWHGLTYENAAQLAKETVSQLFGRQLRASVSRLEAFAACPFKHFAGYTLRLREREVAELGQPDLGNVFHAVLEQLVRQMMRGKLDWSDDRLEAELPTIVQQVGETLRGQLMLSSQRNRYLLRHVEATVRQIIAEQRLMCKKGSKLAPREVEVSFGAPVRSLPALDIRGKEGTLHVNGRIDRVDVIKEQATAAVYDYKLRGKTLKLDEVHHGIALQLLTYLLVLREHGVGEGPLTPVAAFYLQLLRTLPRVKSEEEAEQPREEIACKPRGIISTGAAEALGGAEGGKSPIFAMNYSQQGPRTDWGDLASPEQFDALLDLVRQRLGEIGDEIFAGNIAVRPYMLSRKTPCPCCDYHSVCRFEPSVAGYRLLTPMKRQQALEVLAGGAEVRDG